MTHKDQPAGNYYDKYRTQNPIAKLLMNGFLSNFDSLVDIAAPNHAFEIGCGEGELCIRMARKSITVSGCDISSEIISEAATRAKAAGVAVNFKTSDIRDLEKSDSAPLIVCCEVLEHVANPTAALEIIHNLASPYAILSVPREPLWRIMNISRGKYLSALGNTPGHINHWGRREFEELISKKFEIIDARSPIPWTMALCKARK